ncbi:MAG: DMT family transporter [Clostridiales bacterium]|nr:DMT family transporter [Clostridiales bacterium]
MGNKGRDMHKLGILASIAYCTIYGFSFLASRVALMHTQADILLAVRFSAAMLVMLLMLVIGPYKIDLKGKPVGKFLLMGLCQPVIYFLAETSGIEYTNASFSGLMISLIPIVTVLLSAVFLKERVALRIYGWIMCSVAGVFVISTAQTSSGSIQVRGIIFLLIAVTSAAVFYLISRSVADAFTPFERTFIMMVMGFVFFIGKAIIQEGSEFIPLFIKSSCDPGVMLPVLYLSVISSVAAFLLQNFAITYLDIATATVFENIIPIISVVAGVLILHEPFSAVQFIGIVLILLGVWKVSTEDR